MKIKNNALKNNSRSREKISAIIIVYNEDDVIKRALKSVKGVVDEILVFHDGPCKDDTLNIARKYTKKIFILPRKGRAALHLIEAINKTKNDWIIKIDADEFFSEDLKKNINNLAQNKEVVAYTFIWPWWDGEKYITKKWPIKKSMFRKSKSSFIQYPGWDEPRTKGLVINTPYHLEHKPHKKSAFNFQAFIHKGLGKYGKSQANYTLKPFSEIEKFNYDGSNDFPLRIRLRRNFPILTASVFSVLAFFKILFKNNAWREGKPVFIEAFNTAIYYLFLGYYIYKLKQGKDLKKVFPRESKVL